MRTVCLVALQKLLTLDSEIAMETYIERHESGLSYMAEELAREGRRLERDFQSQGATLRRTDRARSVSPKSWRRSRPWSPGSPTRSALRWG